MPAIPFLLEAAAVLAAFVHWHASPAQSHSVSMLMGIHSFAAYLQLQVVWGISCELAPDQLQKLLKLSSVVRVEIDTLCK
ncbi:hypothetical protein D6089_09100 [Vibrio vulnificus]|nr:hypothetical protein [Vibrio vulnificus]HAS8598534.1 hypothetical protein [Vibrio vulnificus]